MKKIFGIVIIVMSLVSCNNVADWYPTGKVTIETYRVYTNSSTGEKECLINYKIENTGDSSLDKTTFSISLKTDKGEYVSPDLEVNIHPGKSILSSKIITFLDTAEVVANSDDIVVISEYFE